VTAAALLAAPVSKAADNYPSRPIVLVIPLPPGGTNDIMARAVADRMSDALGQRIVIENRNAGGSGTVGTREVARAAPTVTRSSSVTPRHWRLVRTFSAMPVTIRVRILRRSD
jgi:tripartite-type tricarboxylate transporter receptor subunit TctC